MKTVLSLRRKTCFQFVAILFILLELVLLCGIWFGKSYLLEVAWVNGQYSKALFEEMSEKEARVKAAEMAREDFRHGRYRRLVWGLRYVNRYEKYLLDRYQIATLPLAGCVVDDIDKRVADSYNHIMSELLFAKYGRDVFLEAWAETQE